MFGKLYRLPPDSEEMEVVLDTSGSHTNGVAVKPRSRQIARFFLNETLDATEAVDQHPAIQTYRVGLGHGPSR